MMCYTTYFICIFTNINIIRSMPTKYHDIYSMSVQRCQQMLMSGDYMLICNNYKPLIKARAKKAYSKFTEELQSLFGGEEELIEAIGKDMLIVSLKIKKVLLINLREGLLDCYYRKDIDNKIETLDSLKKTYRKIYFDYPKPVDVDADAETQKAQIDSVIKPLESEITRLEYKIKELSPPVNKEAEDKEDKKKEGLELHIMFLQSVSPEHFYRQMSVHDFSKAYNTAVSKNNKLKVKS